MLGDSGSSGMPDSAFGITMRGNEFSDRSVRLELFEC